VSILTSFAILLRAYSYGETSRILRFYTETHGVMGVVARGIRRTGTGGGGGLSTFSQGILSFQHREGRELQNYRDFSPSLSRSGLAHHPLRLAGASVLGEMVLRHSESEGSPSLFHALAHGLSTMEVHPLESFLTGLLSELWPLVVELGYRPLLESCVECGREPGIEEMLRLDFGAGGLRCEGCGGQGPRLGPRARLQLAGLLAGGLGEELLRPRAHLRLASDFITYHVSGGEPLRSMAVLYSLIPAHHA
jgi:DNA repair protein RecO (recombination protein O)